MVVTSNQAVDGAKTGAILGAGSLLMGPALGAPAAGIAANYMTDSGGRMYATAGIGVGLLALLAGGGGGSSTAGRGSK
jgi:hypothetical protein